MSEVHHKDHEGSKMGMWLFLFTEIILFGGLFLLYAVFRYLNAAEFHEAASELSIFMGAANTLILLTSSLTVALSISALERGMKRLSEAALCATILLAAAFMVNKYFEWSHHMAEGMYPNSMALAAKGKGFELFYGLYYVMTGLHGLHVVGGVAVLAASLILVRRGSVNGGDIGFLENSGLFWHLVDLVWIFLFPLFYLVT